MNPSLWAIRNPFLPVTLAVLLAFAGLVALRDLPVTALPALSENRVTLELSGQEIDRQRLDLQVSRPLEAELAALPDLRRIDTDLSGDRLRMVLSFRDIPDPSDLRARIDAALDDVAAKSAIDLSGATVSFTTARDLPVLSLAVTTGSNDLVKASRIVEAEVAPRLQRLDGVGDIIVTGLVLPQLTVRLEPHRLASLGLSPAEVARQVDAALDIMPTARMNAGREARELQLGDTIETPDDLTELLLVTADGTGVPLSAVASINERPLPADSLVRFDGRPAIRLDVFAAPGTDEPSLAARVERGARNVEADHSDLRITVLDRQADASAKRVSATLRVFVEAIGLVALAVLATLRSPRAAGVAMVALPLSIAPCFLILAGLGISLNMVSLLALVLASGIVVDDAIVEIENIERQSRRGLGRMAATERATAEIGLAVIATSACILAVFLPVTFLDGTTARYFYEFGMSLAAATICSLVVARIVVPALAARWLPAVPRQERRSEWWPGVARLHRHVLAFSLRRPGPVIVFTICAIVGSGLLLARMPGDFVPPEDAGTIEVRVDLPDGATAEAADQILSELVAGLAEAEGVASVTTIARQQGGSGQAKMEIRLAQRRSTVSSSDPTVTRTRSRREVEADLRVRLAAVPDIRATLIDPADRSHFAVHVAAGDSRKLTDAVPELVAKLTDHPHIRVAWSPMAVRADTVLEHDADRLETLGLQPADIRETMSLLHETGRKVGSLLVPVAGLSSPQSLPVHVAVDAAGLDKVQLAGAGVPVALTSAVPQKTILVPARLIRRDGHDVALVEAVLAPGISHGQARSTMAEVLGAMGPDAGDLQVLPVGTGEARTEMARDMRSAVLAALALMMSVLLFLYRSAVQTLVVLVTLPFAVGGAMIGLVALGMPLSLPVLLGVLLLLGIVAKNAILVIDHALRQRSRFSDLAPALLLAGRRRARAVTTTSLAMCAGMLPAALGLGEGAAFRQPMAIAVIGGILASTAMCLVVVPALSLLADRTVRRVSPLPFGYSARRRHRLRRGAQLTPFEKASPQ